MCHIPTLFRRLVFAAVLFTLTTTPLHAQSALDGFDPHANDRVYCIARQYDGKILIGGSFSMVLGVTRNHIARLNADGTLDTNFNPNASGTVYAITVNNGSGENLRIYAGGDFVSIGGQPRKYVAELDGTNGAATAFDANANSGVRCLLMDPHWSNDRVFVGGLFTGTNSIGGQARNHLARLFKGTGLADEFNPDANDVVLSLALQFTNTALLVGGNFNHIGGQTRSCLARLPCDDCNLADSFDPGPNGLVYSIDVQIDGKILAAGNFASAGGAMRRGVVRLDSASGLADSFDPKPNNDLRSVVVQRDGRIVLGGYFTTLAPNGGLTVTRNYIARMNTDGSLDTSFDPNANADVQAIGFPFDEKVLLAGSFTTLAPNGGAPVPRNYIARMEADGRLDRTLNLSLADSNIVATALQPDGKILIGGSFSNVLGVTRNNLARLFNDGTLDTNFNPNANGTVRAIAVQPDGHILVGGEFQGTNSIGGAARNYIARLNPDGTADPFDPNANGAVLSLAVDANGSILVGGLFSSLFGPNTTIGGAKRNFIARLNSTNGLADAFDPSANDAVFSIAIQTNASILVGGRFSGTNSIGGANRNHIARLDPATALADAFDPNASDSVSVIALEAVGQFLINGSFTNTSSILVGGSFTNIAGTNRNFIARLDPATAAADPAFDPNADGPVLSIALQSYYQHKRDIILVGGQFSNIGGQPRSHIARLDGTNGLADSFNPSASDTVLAITLAADGKILVGGLFNGPNSIGGQARNLFARLANEIGGFTGLNENRYDIDWYNFEGSRFSRVTFELSSNNIDYTPLPVAVESENKYWIIPNYSPPDGRNLYIRARGYYSGGSLNGSGSIKESIRYFFLPVQPPRLNIQPAPDMSVVLFWQTNNMGFTLESKTDLKTNGWTVVSPAPVVSGENFVVTNPASGTARFYRLRRP